MPASGPNMHKTTTKLQYLAKTTPNNQREIAQDSPKKDKTLPNTKWMRPKQRFFDEGFWFQIMSGGGLGALASEGC